MLQRFRLIAFVLLWVITAFGAWAQVAADAPAAPDLPPLPSPEQIDVPQGTMPILLVPLTAADLSELAVVWQGHLKATLEDIARLNFALNSADEAQAEALRTAISQGAERQRVVHAHYSDVLYAWERKGAAAEDLAPHNAYLSALAVDAVRTTDARTLLVIARDWAFSRDGGLGLMLRLLGIVAAVWALMLVARLLRRAAQRGMDRIPTVSRLLKAFVVTSVYWVSFGLGILVVLGLFGFNVTPLFAVFGGLSFILGFALQETLGNLASGLMIMILKPFDTGDYIQVSGSSGFVDEMSVVSTTIRTFDNQIIVVPNSKIWGDVITNVSASPERRVDLVFGIAYSDSAAQAIEVLGQLVEAHPMCLKEPEAEIFVGELGDNSVNIFCRPWCLSGDYWTVYWDLTGQAKERFDAEGISIPFPQRDVHLIPADA